MMIFVSHCVCIIVMVQLVSTFRFTPPSRLNTFPSSKMCSADMNWDPKEFPKLDFNEDYYSVLEVVNTVDAKELKKAYYKLVFKYHPDNIENVKMKETCNKQMMVINGAYKILKVVNLRAMYDKQRKKGLSGIGTGVKENSVSIPDIPPSRPPPQRAPPSSPAQEAVRCVYLYICIHKCAYS
jgi:hypothetical protein